MEKNFWVKLKPPCFTGRKKNIFLFITCLAVLTLLFKYAEILWDEHTSEYLILRSEEPVEDAILFIEGYGNRDLPKRMLCSIESAAKANPSKPVYVLTATPKLRKTEVLLRVLTYPNIDIIQLNFSRVFLGSPLEHWYLGKRWRWSWWPYAHFNDGLRWAVLWRYGGLYLDTDVIVLRSLSNLPNGTGLESDTWASAGVVKFSRGHPFMTEILKDFDLNFDGSIWGANGPKLITRVLVDRCGLQLPSGNLSRCDDIAVMPKRAFYPIAWWDWRLYLQEDKDLATLLLTDKEVLALHVWNMHTQAYPVPLDAHTPYAMAAQVSCPVTVHFSDGVF
ncbi:lactosylceramide 4-alpha-galactosyltransferase-like [Oratosquilla oratoria]|uniref:lactosylceramide 4-alpha-galactosyltransferase-like n=1 Tax=Oratosquilla oratoria TaxID=337810 RepID=UPI003F761FB7